MKIELDLKVIKRNSQRREDENLRFRRYLKGEDSENIDKIVHQLYENVLDHIDCTECGNCCIELETCFQKTEIERLCQFLDMDTDEFIKKNTKTSELEDKDTFVLKSTPCQFLENKKCTIYSHRPEECSSYPYLHKDQFNSRLLGVLNNYEICPIVYNVFELLKKELNYKR